MKGTGEKQRLKCSTKKVSKNCKVGWFTSQIDQLGACGLVIVGTGDFLYLFYIILCYFIILFGVISCGVSHKMSEEDASHSKVPRSQITAYNLCPHTHTYTRFITTFFTFYFITIYTLLSI